MKLLKRVPVNRTVVIGAVTCSIIGIIMWLSGIPFSEVPLLVAAVLLGRVAWDMQRPPSDKLDAVGLKHAVGLRCADQNASGRAMRILTCPRCRSCDLELTWDRTAVNVIRTLVAVSVAAVVAECVGIWWRCGKCGRRYLVLGQTVIAEGSCRR